MNTIEECCKELSACAINYASAAEDSDKFFEASERILEICDILKKNHSQSPDLLEDMLNDRSEPVRRVAAFCLLECFSCDNALIEKALRIVVDFLENSFGSQHIVWLTWLENFERRTQKKSGYKLRAELSQLTENYADKWLKAVREKQNSNGFVSETPVYPFDSFEFVSSDDSQEDDDSLPY